MHVKQLKCAKDNHGFGARAAWAKAKQNRLCCHMGKKAENFAKNCVYEEPSVRPLIEEILT